MHKIDTKVVHEVRVEPLDETPAMPPIYQTSTFAFQKAEMLGNKISKGGDNETFVYTRGSNPTQRTLEKSVANLEGSEDAICTASGMSAITLVAMTFLKKGDHTIVGSITYGDTYALFGEIMTKYGVEVTFVDTTNVENIKSAIRENTKLVFFETPSNPTSRVTDIIETAKLTKARGIKLAVDNTIMSPYFQKPITLGADLSINSTTKYLNGHSDVLGGVIACSREDYLKLRSTLFITGPVLDPHAAWLVLRGMKTLHVRLERHQKNTREVVNFLLRHPKVGKIYHTLVPNHPDYAVFEKQMTGHPSIISFEIVGGLEQAQNFINNLQIFKRAVSLGGVESLAEHPASMSHAPIPRERRLEHGITDNLVRISVGIEDSEDLIEDIKNALG